MERLFEPSLTEVEEMQRAPQNGCSRVCECSWNMGGRVSTQVACSIMADECTDVTTIEELTICCRWVESGVPEEHFYEILPLKKANTESIYSPIVEYCKEKNIRLGRLIGMEFDGAATFSGDKTGIQRR